MTPYWEFHHIFFSFSKSWFPYLQGIKPTHVKLIVAKI